MLVFPHHKKSGITLFTITDRVNNPKIDTDTRFLIDFHKIRKEKIYSHFNFT